MKKLKACDQNLIHYQPLTSTERSSSVMASRTLLQNGHASVDKVNLQL